MGRSATIRRGQASDKVDRPRVVCVNLWRARYVPYEAYPSEQTSGGAGQRHCPTGPPSKSPPPHNPHARADI